MSNNYYSGFCQINPFGTSEYQHQLGVLNNKAVSYSRTPQFYYKDKDILELIIFRGVSETDQNTKIPTTHVGPILEVLNWFYTQATAGKFTSSKPAATALVVSEYPDYTIKTLGNMVTNGNIYLPAHIELTIPVDGVAHDFRVWFAVDNFLAEFPYRDIFVFGPVPPDEIDILLTDNYKQLAERFAQETPDKLEKRVQALIGDNLIPYTWRDVWTFDVVDRINTGKTTKGCWTIILWGNPLNADDDINEQIKDCIIGHSNKSEDEWGQVLPDIFNPLEFFLVPHWDRQGLDNKSPIGSTYSPVSTYQSGDTLAQKYADFYEESFIRSSLEFVPHLWKSVCFSVVGKPNNNGGQTTFSSVFPDYQLIPSTDTQSGSMTELTSQAIYDLEVLLSAAEVASDSGFLPTGVSKVTRKDRLYVTMKSGKVKFTCISRQQFVTDGLLADD